MAKQIPHVALELMEEALLEDSSQRQEKVGRAILDAEEARERERERRDVGSLLLPHLTDCGLV